MKFRSTAVAVLAAAAISAPLAAHAATYEPFTATDPSYDATTAPDEPTNPGVDLVKSHGTRTGSTIAIAITFSDLKRVSYSRRIAFLSGSSASDVRFVEYRTAGPGSTPKVVFYKGDQAAQDFEPTSCKGVKATVSAPKDRITFTIPAACYPGSDDDGAFTQAVALKYTPKSWTPGPLTVEQVMQADQLDFISQDWAWTPGPVMQKRASRGLL